jgi:hypothetical protein
MSTPAFVHRSARPRSESNARFATLTADGIAYALVLGGIYLLLGTLWFMSAKEKLIDDNGTAPAGLHRMFSGTFISSFPGTNAAWVILGALEGVAFLVILASFLRGEFLPHRPKPILLAGIAGSMAVFAILAFGDTVAQNNDGTASLFTYFAATGVLLIVTLLMPPYRPTAWLSSLISRDATTGRGAGA